MDFLIKDGVLVRYTRKYADSEIFIPEGIREIADWAFFEVKNLQLQEECELESKEVE